MEIAVEIHELTYAYDQRKVLDNLSFSVPPGEIFGVLGPNGSGKTTLFRILSTLILARQGKVKIYGLDLATANAEVRKKIGVVFQNPALDIQLSVFENLMYQGQLYGLSGQKLKDRAEVLLKHLGLLDRRNEKAKVLSGGLKRRLELAKGLLHQPAVLLLDEPSTGLDPGARRDLWTYLLKLRKEEGVTLLVTTHLMEEAEHCDRIVILEQGKRVALETPQRLKQEAGAERIELTVGPGEDIASQIRGRFGVRVHVTAQGLQIEHGAASAFLPQLLSAFPGKFESVTLRKPTLEDVFLMKTGHRYWEAGVVP